MCGIAGIFAYSTREPVDQRLLESMADSMLHRGPDDAGFYVDEGIGFSFRRLSIIDIEGGHQPMSNADESTWVMLNGEIYNFRELRRELESAGHRFRTASDTESIVHGYDRWGPQLTNHLNGMFGFAVWDRNEQQLLLARDHMGIKPLYYFDDGKRIIFGSELRTILTDPSVPREIDPEALRIFLTYGYLPSPYTLFKNLRKLPPGHRLIAGRNGVRVERYWNTIPRIDNDIDVPTAVEKYTSLVNDAVNRQMVSDVPVGSLLSGGVDSGIVTAAMCLSAKENGQSDPVQSFTVGFGDQFEWDEIEDAAETADILGTQHQSFEIEADDFADFFQTSTWHLEEPVLSQSTFAYYQLTKRASDHVTVVLTGQGADEPWAGYHRYFGEKYGGNVRWALDNPFTNGLMDRLPDSNRHAERVRRATASLGEHDPLSRFVNIHSVFGANDVPALLHRDLTTDVLDTDAAAPMRYWQRDVAHLDGLSQLLHIDSRMSLPDDLLLYGDKLAMANSLETRVPLLDVELMEFVETLPANFKLRGRNTKYVHKKAASNWLPEHVINRIKRGFATPVDTWFQGALDSFLNDTMLAPDSACGEFFERSELDRILSEHRSGGRNHRRKLTTLLSFELWHRQFMRSSSPNMSL